MSTPEIQLDDANRNMSQTAMPSTPIAIVGMSCRFAGGANNPSKLWDLISGSEDAWSPIPKDRFDALSLYHPDQQRTDRVRLSFVKKEKQIVNKKLT